MLGAWSRPEAQPMPGDALGFILCWIVANWVDIYFLNFFPMTGMQRLIPETFHCSGALPTPIPPLSPPLLSLLSLSPPLPLYLPPYLFLSLAGARTWVLQAALGEAGAARVGLHRTDVGAGRVAADRVDVGVAQRSGEGRGRAVSAVGLRMARRV